MDDMNTETDNPASDPPASADATPVATSSEAETVDEWKKVRELALKQLDRFLSLEPKVLRGDDPDAIHDMRVASRRLQQILDLLYPKPFPRQVRRLRRKIQRCRRALGELRNCDVLLANVERTLNRKRTARRESWEAVWHYLRQQRAEHFERALRKLSKVNLAVFYVRLKDCLASEGLGAELADAQSPVDQQVVERFPERFGQALDRVWRVFEAQVALSLKDPSPSAIHGVRIAAKRLRYLIEVINAFEVPGSGDMLAWLRKLQQHLGDWHDREVLEQMMIEMLARPQFLRDHLEIAMSVAKLILRNRANKKGYEDKYFRMTQDSAEWERLKEWVGYVVASPSGAWAKA